MPRFIYDGPGHTLVIAGQPLQRGMPTELSGRAAQEAANHPNVHEATKADADAGGAADSAPAWGTTVKEALAYVGEDRDRATEVLDAERARGDDARSSLIDKLEALLAAEDEEDSAE